MIKRILLSVLFVIPLLGKNDPKDVELMAKLNKLEMLKQDIAEKEKYIDAVTAEASKILLSMTDAYDKEQLNLICKEANRLESSMVYALINNIHVDNAIKERLSPEHIAYRHEIDRVQHAIVRVAAEYFFLNKLYQQYNDLLTEIVKYN